MDAQKVIEELKKKYPSERIIQNSRDNPAEIICEVDPSTNHPEYSLAIAVIDKSVAHVHRKSRETYRVVKGSLTLYVDGSKYELGLGEELVIEPGQVHWAEGQETWVECYSEPGWSYKDHILVKP